MMHWLVDWSVRFRRIVLALGVGLLVFGIVQLDGVKKDILPEFSPVTVEVQTEALGLSAGEVERLMTIPLEQDLLSGVAFLESIESASLPGLSSVVMTFEPGTELLDARQVKESLQTCPHSHSNSCNFLQRDGEVHRTKVNALDIFAVKQPKPDGIDILQYAS